jgi:glycosyltransferase involved in cell wall biosynthesis
MVCSQMPPVYGGAGAQAVLLSRKLIEQGWEVTAVTLDQAGVGSSNDHGVRISRLLRGIAPKNRWSRLLTTLGLGIGAFVRIAVCWPSVVHIHGAYWWSILPAVAGRLTGAKVVVKLTREGEDDAQTVFAKRVGRIGVGRVHGLSLTLADSIVVLNRQALRIAAAEGLGSRTRFISNGVDDVAFVRSTSRRLVSRAAKELSVDDRVVMFVGYLVRHKGVVDLLEAWRQLGNRAARLWLVGPYEGFYREIDGEVPRLIDDLNRDGYQVETLGFVPPAELPALYWAADVFALPSYAEGMPNSLAEALVAGCHVVATRIPGITELMGSDSVDLVTPGDVSALATRLAAALETPRQVPNHRIERLWISNTAREVELLYLELLSGQP